MTHRVLGVIPARIGSTRLPEKPLLPLLGRPLIAWAWEGARRTGAFDRLVVATDSSAIARVCEDLGAIPIMTGAHHESGTDRVAEVARKPEFSGFDVIVNVQGDEPLVRGTDIGEAVALVREGWDVGTCAMPLSDPAAFGDPSVVKVARGYDGRALYFSRAPIPFRRDDPLPNTGERKPLGWGHLGIYAYTSAALDRWSHHPPTPLEQVERLEQLRALEIGLQIGVATVPPAPQGVDTPHDIARTERLLEDFTLTTHA